MRAILTRIASHNDFLTELNKIPNTAFEGYNLTREEKVALCNGDVDWIEAQVGKLDEQLRVRLKWPPQAMQLSPEVEEVLREFKKTL